jgi:hypothetical protein
MKRHSSVRQWQETNAAVTLYPTARTIHLNKIKLMVFWCIVLHNKLTVFKQREKSISTEYWYKCNQRLELVKGRIYLRIKLEIFKNGGNKIHHHHSLDSSWWALAFWRSLLSPFVSVEGDLSSANRYGFYFLRFRNNVFYPRWGCQPPRPTPSNPGGPMFFCRGCLPSPTSPD